jgi:hypothetical protein
MKVKGVENKGAARPYAPATQRAVCFAATIHHATVTVRWPVFECCSFDLSATSHQYFSFRTNQPPVIRQQYFSLRTNQHQPSATSQTKRVVFLLSKSACGELAIGMWRPNRPPQICGRQQRSVAECGVEPNTPSMPHGLRGSKSLYWPVRDTACRAATVDGGRRSGRLHWLYGGAA